MTDILSTIDNSSQTPRIQQKNSKRKLTTTSLTSQVGDNALEQPCKERKSITAARTPTDQDFYIYEIYNSYRASEKKFPISSTFIIGQAQITERLRKIMIDWVVKLNSALQLLPETLYLSVNIIDRYLSVSPVRKDIYQLVAIASVLAASKFEEVYPPMIDDFLTVTRHLFSRDQIIKMEYIILAALSYELALPTSLHFMRHYILMMDVDEIYVALSQFILESTLMDTLFYSLVPSQIAAGVIYLTNVTQMRLPWPERLEEFVGYTEEVVKPWASLIRNHLVRLKGSTTLKGILKKYQSEEFFEVALIELPKV